MIYLNTRDIEFLGLHWGETIEVIKDATEVLRTNDFDQPLKPYLSFDDQRNRIIAMPARGSAELGMAGIKWISSFPQNIDQGIPRAHCITVLNSSDTGQPLAVFNSSLLSGIRTASVSGMVLSEYKNNRAKDNYVLGIVGFGPIGQLHLKMADHLLAGRLQMVRVFDIRGVDKDLVPSELRHKVEIVKSWEQAYLSADIFVTCTVSSAGYIDKRPKPGALLLNVSLRDFSPKILDHNPIIIVDDWDEVCRAGTDINVFHQLGRVKRQDTKSLSEVISTKFIRNCPPAQPIMVNPMGMALFDIAICGHYYKKAREAGVGVELFD